MFIVKGQRSLTQADDFGISVPGKYARLIANTVNAMLSGHYAGGRAACIVGAESIEKPGGFGCDCVCLCAVCGRWLARMGCQSAGCVKSVSSRTSETANDRPRQREEKPQDGSATPLCHGHGWNPITLIVVQCFGKTFALDDKDASDKQTDMGGCNPLRCFLVLLLLGVFACECRWTGSRGHRLVHKQAYPETSTIPSPGLSTSLTTVLFFSMRTLTRRPSAASPPSPLATP
uniref:Ketoacyl_synth_N domain-containing protein n=1 Tax=Steinernema glaseri TaxID=37863 RepID=A0A1I7YYL3_9BILA